MAYPVVLKQLTVSSLNSRFVIPFRPTMVTDAVLDRFSTTCKRAYHVTFTQSLISKTISPKHSKREDDKELCLSVQMPGIEKEEVKATVKNCEYYVMDIKGKVMNNFERTKYTRKFIIPKYIKMSGITAEMNDGVLRVTLPKLKQKEIVPDKLVVKIS